GITLGKKLPAIVGQSVADKDGNEHEGIITFPVSVLAGRKELIKSLRQKLFGADFSDVVAVDFSDLAQGCKTYAEYINKMADTSESALAYFGIVLCGDKKKINRLTGNLPLLK
ncbi:MAG: DUF2000 domain-containing protein, partial [Treponema sp.]|nr:DUF2000 domain-containing protein [Treponema sp.]